MLTPEVLKFVHRIQIKTAHLAKGLLTGMYVSAFKGKGLEFYDTREYQPGDEERHIDWNQSSRSNRLLVKTFQEERQLNILILLDISASGQFGSQQQRKNQLMAEIGGVLAFAALRNNDKVGLILFTDHVETYLPPRQQPLHILHIIREMLLHKPTSRGTDAAAALKFLGKLPLKSGVCFLISDFLCQDFSKEASLLARKHDLIGIAITDPAETNFPTMPLAEFQDLETEQIEVLSIDKNAQVKKQSKDNKKMLQRIGADFIEISTDQPYLPILQNFFKIRSKR